MAAMKYLSMYLRNVALAVNLNHLNEAWEERFIIIQSDIVIESADLAFTEVTTACCRQRGPRHCRIITADCIITVSHNLQIAPTIA